MAGAGLCQFNTLGLTLENTALQAESIEIPLPTGISLRGLSWNANAPIKVLALHGWLDNAHSFLPLAESLPNDIHLIAIDQAGHGWSDHRQGNSWYYLTDFVHDIALLTKALAWSKFSLLGHSLGGAVSCMVATALTEQVQALTVIEGLGPLSGKPQQASQRFREAIDGLSRANKTHLRRHANPMDATTARLKTSQMSSHSAAQLVERGLKQVDDGWIWRTDPRLRVTSPVRFTETEIQYILEGIQCPVLQVLPKPVSAMVSLPQMQRRYAMLKNYQQVDIDGHHHLHMDKPIECATAIFPFFIEHQERLA